MKEINEIRSFGSPQAALLVRGPKDLIKHLVGLVEEIKLLSLESLTQKELDALIDFMVDEKIDLAIL